MWHRSYSDRLMAWSHLRSSCANQDQLSCLRSINQWWMSLPWCAYRLHWDDRASWPDPWQLLEENQFCSLACGLGILYTICLLNRTDTQDATLVEVGNDNLVQVAKKKYILNWHPDVLLSNQEHRLKPRHCITQKELKLQLL